MMTVIRMRRPVDHFVRWGDRIKREEEGEQGRI